MRAIKRSEYLNARNSYNKLLRKTEREYRRTISVDTEFISSTNQNEFWNKIRYLGPKHDSSIPMAIVNEQGHSVTDENAVYDRWKRDFENLYNSVESDDFDNEFYDRAKLHKHLIEMNIEDPLYVPNEQLNNNISLEESANAVMKAKSKSACGIDNIPYAVLKFPPVIEVLHQLFQMIFDTSIIPSDWRKAIIYPILKDKNSDKRLPLNYRGVSLLSCISKLFSSFINKRISSYLEDRDILADEQNGFRRGRSCEDHAFTLSSLARNHDNLHTAFIDLRKAFDFVDRDMLLYKLLLNGIDGKVYNAVKRMYEHTTSCIRINNKLTTCFNCNSGVAQGNNLSPTLFAIFVNDLVSEINDLDLGVPINGTAISILLYADDIALVAESEHDLQTVLDTLHKWCKRWRVLINTEKSKCIHFRRGRQPPTEFSYHIGNNSLELVKEYKYLGLIFD